MYFKYYIQYNIQLILIKFYLLKIIIISMEENESKSAELIILKKSNAIDFLDKLNYGIKIITYLYIFTYI